MQTENGDTNAASMYLVAFGPIVVLIGVGNGLILYLSQTFLPKNALQILGFLVAPATFLIIYLNDRQPSKTFSLICLIILSIINLFTFFYWRKSRWT
jgi:hypothetical protein